MTNLESHDVLERRALELLPWYVNGTLNDEDREQVSRQALTSLSCRKDLERLMARIRASDSPARPRVRQPERWFALARWAVAASLAAIVSVPLWWRGEDTSSTPRIYETLTRSQCVDAGSVRLRVVFAAGVTRVSTGSTCEAPAARCIASRVRIP